MERCKIIICSTLIRTSSINIDDYVSYCQVGRNTIINDLKAVNKMLKEVDLELVYENKVGYHIVGDVVRKRTIFFLYFYDLIAYYQKGIIKLDNVDKVDEVLMKLLSIESKLNAQFVRGVIFSLAVFFSSIEYRSDHFVFNQDSIDEITNTLEFKYVDEVFSSYKYNDKLYLTLHLLGSRLQTSNLASFNQEEQTYQIAKNLVMEFSKISCIEFENVQQLEQSLYMHLKTSIYRYRYGILLGNPLLEDIMREYDTLFELTKKACEYLVMVFGVPIPNSEIAYITLHFGSFIKTNRRKDVFKVLVVCPNGLSTSNMLKQEIKGLVNSDVVIDAISLNDYDTHHNYDVVVSTVQFFDKDQQIIVVNPILSDTDRFIIMSTCMKMQNSKRVNVNDVLSIVKKNVSDDQFDLVKKELNYYFANLDSVSDVSLKNHYLGLLDFIGPDFVKFHEETFDDYQAIKVSGQRLVDLGYIESRYLDSIYEQNKMMNDYMFVNNHVMLAHTNIDNGALKLGLCLNIFKEPVYFSDKKLAKVIIVLVAKDQHSHIGIIEDLMKLFNDHDVLEQLYVCDDYARVIRLIGESLNKIAQ
ncbi:MAG: BglG family transcription antiterminator, partial [Erysipelotrichaceae bacterium]